MVTGAQQQCQCAVIGSVSAPRLQNDVTSSVQLQEQTDDVQQSEILHTQDLETVRPAALMTGAARKAAMRVLKLRFGSLRARIASLYAGLFALVLGLVVALAAGGLSEFAEANAAQDLAANGRVFDEILGTRARQMSDQASVLAHDFGFRQAVATGDVPTINSALVSLEARAGSDTAFIITLNGDVFAADPGEIPAVDTLWANLDAGKTEGLIRTRGGLSLAVVAPVKAPDVIGWLIIAQPLDRQELDRLVDLAPIALDAQVVDSSTHDPWLRHANTDVVIARDHDERTLYYTSVLFALQDGLRPRLVLRHSLSDSLAAYAGLKTLLLVLAASGLLIVLWMSIKVARSVTEPLHQLAMATRQISEGQKVTLKIDTRDEIGRLANSFNAMAAAIEEREREIIHVGLHDSLTGLPNRKLFSTQLETILGRRRAEERIMVAYIDIDDFKMINDTLGHPAGDDLLCQLASHLQQNLSNTLIARLGGDEFAILIDGISGNENLVSIAEQLQEACAHSVLIDGRLAECSASIGIAIAPDDSEDGNILMRNADLALYRAKHEGKGRYHFFEPALDEAARERRQLELDLRAAITEGGFTLNFQPLYSIYESRLTGFEALIRWHHPTRGWVNPAQFIPLAEETGLIIPIGEWVLREACRQASTWPAHVSVAVNVSPKQFAAHGITGTVVSALSGSRLQAHRLELEITESIFISDAEHTLAKLNSLRQLGVKIALDDFGTGYSSLSYLRSFPFDKVKIDKSFVEELAISSDAPILIRAITTLAAAFGMDTLAEGVENLGQYEVLVREGCKNIQGYLISRPVEAWAVAGLLSFGEVRTIIPPVAPQESCAR